MITRILSFFDFCPGQFTFEVGVIGSYVVIFMSCSYPLASFVLSTLQWN